MAESGQVENNSEGGDSAPQQQQQTSGTSSQATSSSSSTNAATAATVSMEEAVVIEEDYRGPPAAAPPLSEEPLPSSEPNSPPHEDSYSSGGEYHDDAGPLFMAAHSTSGGVVLLEQHQQYVSPSATPPHLLHHHPMLGVQSKGLPSSDHLVGQQLPSNPGSPPPQGEELRRLLLKQLEYYFSKENLAADKYLLSQMDGDHYVPVQILASFNQVKKLTVDMELILEVIRESTLLQLDETEDKVRAIPEKRCVLILREIPQDTPESAITGLFSGKTCPNCVTCQFADNDCWYVTFDSEEDTQKAYAFLREEVREFLGQPIRARIKGTQATRSSGMPKKNRGVPSYQNSMPSVYNGPQMPFYHQPAAAAAPGGVVPPPSSWSPQYYDPNYIHYVNGFPQQQHQQGFSGPQQGHIPANSYHGGGGPEGRGTRGRGNGRLPRSHSPSSIPNGGVGEIPSDRGRGREHYGGRGYRRDNEDTQRKIPRLNRKNREQAEREKERTQPPPRQQARPQQKLDLAPANFPPLPTADSGLVSPTPAPPPNHVEEGVSNLADIVKGRRYREGNGFFPQNGLSSIGAGEVANSDGNCPSYIEQKDAKVVSQTVSVTASAPVLSVTVTAASIVKQSPVVQPSVSAIPLPAGSQTTAAAAAPQTSTQTVQLGSGSSSSVARPQTQPVAPPRPPRTESSKSVVKDTRQIVGSSSVVNNNKGYVRYGDRENGSSKQNGSRNTQVTSKTDIRPAQSASRNRHKERDKRPGSASRLTSTKPSPKSPKKPVAPPPPPTPTTPAAPPSNSLATTATSGQQKNNSSSVTASSSMKAQPQECSTKSEKLSYAQMIRRKAQPSPQSKPIVTSSSTSSGPQSKAPSSSVPAGLAAAASDSVVLIGTSKSLPSSPVHKVAMEIGGRNLDDSTCTSN